MTSERTMNALLGQPGTVLLPASAGAVRRQVPVDELLSAAAAEGAAVWHLHCDFAEGGPWAGVRDLFRSLLDDIRRQRPDLIEMHDYELLYVLPELRRQMKLRNPCLTDIATAEERIRNYPADRAFRITHGLIDLLAEYKQTTAAGRTWLWVCADYDSAGAMASHFLQELMRRRGEELRLVLLPVFSGRGPDAGSLGFSCAVRELPFGVAVPVREALDPREAARQAAVLDLEIDANALGRTAKLPDVIYLWSLAGRKDKVLRRCTHAVESYNVLGLYRDAQRYGERAQSLLECPEAEAGDKELRWWVVYKVFLSYLGTGEPEKALALVSVLDRPDAGIDDRRLIAFCYLMAMLHARFLPERDLARGEEYLDRGLRHLENAGLAAPDYWFQYVFNRNGLAMIRSFQGRFEEALELCVTGFRILEERLSKVQHNLHRSVLLFNMAQVYVQTGRLDLAIEHLSAAMEMDPNYSEYFNDRGSLYLRLGRLDEAERDYRQGIALSPPYHEIWTNLGSCLRLQGRFDEAVLAFSRALDLKPAAPASLFGRAQAREALGAAADALADYAAVLEANPTHWQACAARAVLLYEGGRIEECLADLDRAVALAPREADLYMNRAVALADLQRPDDAKKDLEKYLDLCPDAPDHEGVQARLAALDDMMRPAYTASAG
ncbi:MAG TPA: tetratricopeptide repeat protein [Thermoanaerobaculia bacterium]|nr:tetratricopeptide repeat protein [Thermoanaerobaculia bacterium]